MKLLIIGILLYFLYNMVMKRSMIPGGRDNNKINDQGRPDDGEYVDYEEVD